jgi:hypothetical protein
MRANGSAICTRTIQVDCKADQLDSAFCYILRAPFRIVDNDGENGRVFVWIGNKSDPDDRETCIDVVNELINKTDQFPIETIREGAESDAFWEHIGGRKSYQTNAEFMLYSRLFRCTNEKGYFSVSEKTIDFCQVCLPTSVHFLFVG